MLRAPLDETRRRAFTLSQQKSSVKPMMAENRTAGETDVNGTTAALSPRRSCLCLPGEDNCSVRPAAPYPSSAAGPLRPPGRRHDGAWWARFGIITLVDLVDSCSAAALGAGSQGDCSGAINHDHGRVDRALAGHATITATSGLRAEHSRINISSILSLYNTSFAGVE